MATDTAYILEEFEGASTTFSLNSQEFRFRAIRPDMSNIDIGSLVTSATWRDEGTEDNLNAIPVLRGSLVLTKPHPDQLGADIHIEDGHRVRCEVFWSGKWVHLWEMRITTPAIQIQDGNWTFEMADDLVLTSQSEGNFRYRRGKVKKRNGWRYDEIVRDVARRYRIPLGQIIRGTHRIKNLSPGRVSPLEVIRQAVAAEQKHTGRRYVIVWKYSPKAGRYAMHIIRLRRNPLMYVLREQILAGTVETIRDEKLLTAITARGSGKKKGEKKRKRYTSKQVSAAAVQRYGYIHKVVDIPGNIDSQGELDRKAKRYLANSVKPKTVLAISHQGIAFIRRGDALRVEVPQEGVTGAGGIVFVTSVAHTLSSGSYTMDLTLQFTDPLDPKKLREERDKALRARKRKKAT